MGSIDKMDWHYGGDFPKGLLNSNAGTHIGMYLAWVINNNLIGELHREDSLESIQAVKAKEMTGRDFLIKECDEKFWDDDLNEEGLAFTKYYYADDEGMKQYIIDYAETFRVADSLYEVEDLWDNYDKISQVIDQKFTEWKTINS